jgi:hypothetical protein
MMIYIVLHTENDHFCASAQWGQSSWHRDPISAISELFGKALPYASLYRDRAAKPQKTPKTAAPRPGEVGPDPGGEFEGTPSPQRSDNESPQ